jgi:hypothetical protein
MYLGKIQRVYLEGSGTALKSNYMRDFIRAPLVQQCVATATTRNNFQNVAWEIDV